MGEVIIPNLEEATKNCHDCNAVKYKVRIGVGELACRDTNEAAAAEKEWGEYVGRCKKGPELTGVYGTEQQECQHPGEEEGVLNWHPQMYL